MYDVDIQCTETLRAQGVVQYHGLTLFRPSQYNLWLTHSTETTCNDVQRTMYDVRSAMYDGRRTTYDARCTTYDARAMYDVQYVPRLGEFRGLCNVMDWHCLSLVSIV